MTFIRAVVQGVGLMLKVIMLTSIYLVGVCVFEGRGSGVVRGVVGDSILQCNELMN